jgi:hypothetical protein
MNRAALPFPVALVVVSGMTLAKAANDSTAQPRSCFLVESADRSECLDRLSHAAAPSHQLALAGDGWIISETTSPVDYSPIATATTSSLNVAGGGPSMQLSIRCRGGRTELTVTGPAITGRGDGYFISYQVNDNRAVRLAGVVPVSGDGVAFKGDVVGLLQSLPAEGELIVRLFPLSGNSLDGIFSLNGLDTLRTKIGATCRWPHAIAKPNNR